MGSKSLTVKCFTREISVGEAVNFYVKYETHEIKGDRIDPVFMRLCDSVRMEMQLQPNHPPKYLGNGWTVDYLNLPTSKNSKSRT